MKIEKPLTRQAVIVLSKMKELGCIFIRWENGQNWYGHTGWMCLYNAGIVILARRGLATITRTKSGMNIERLELNAKGISRMEAL